MRRLTTITALLLATLLTACGGGDPEDQQDVDTPRVDCAKEPEKCK